MALNVKVLRLVNGQEVVAEVLNEDETGIRIKNPVMVMVIPTKSDPNNPQVGFGPWANFSDDKEFVLNRATVIAVMNPIKEFINQYNSMFGGLVLPTGPTFDLDLGKRFTSSQG